MILLSQKAVERGAKGVHEPWEEGDEFGTVTFATVQTVSQLQKLHLVIAFLYGFRYNSDSSGNLLVSIIN